jgi:hypothetical protein
MEQALKNFDRIKPFLNEKTKGFDKIKLILENSMVSPDVFKVFLDKKMEGLKKFALEIKDYTSRTGKGKSAH